jgi:hypothetical protein
MLELFSQFLLWRDGWQELTIQPRIAIPFRNNPFPTIEAVNINNGMPMYQYSVEMYLMYGIGGALPQFNNFTWYLSNELGYEQDFAPSVGQMHMDFNIGFKAPHERWVLELKSLNTFKTNDPIVSGSHVNYDVFSLRPGFLYFINKYVGLEFGVTQDIAGKFIAKGTSYDIAIWVRNFTWD